MKYRIKQIVYIPLESDPEEQREFDEAFSELVGDTFSNTVAPESFIERLKSTLEKLE